MRVAFSAFALAWLAFAAAAADLSALARLDPEASGIADEAGGGVRLALALSQPVPYRIGLLDGPPRLVIDFREVDFGLSRPAAIDRSDRVRAVAWGGFRAGWSRLVAELDGPFRLVSAEERRGADGGAELVIRLAPSDPAGFAEAAARSARDAAASGGIWALPPAAQVAGPKRRQTGEAPLVVVLDPGHGGIDPGAEADGMTEAAIILTFARELSDVLRREGMRVTMTRQEDVFVPLETRISLARAAGADVFLSLHADALEEGEATGATVYRLAEAASDAASERLAERHDRTDLLAGIDLSGHDDMVAGVLMDLARTETEPRAGRLALALKEAIGAAGLKMHRHPIQGASFSVLKAADIPSLLLEVGFLSSAKDRERLVDPEWRAKMQGAILAALQAWAVADAEEALLLRQ
ncbi:MAG: N-acetylmuramoyl-L-alanine amidase [Paracoccaceae bacterium]